MNYFPITFETSNKNLMPIVSVGFLGICGYTLFKVFSHSQEKVREARKQAILKLDLDPLPSPLRRLSLNFTEGSLFTE